MSMRRRGNVRRAPRIYRAAPLRRRGRHISKCDNSGLDSEGRILLSNVGQDVDDDRIKEIFDDLGNVKKVLIHFNENKARIGTAEVWMKNGKEANYVTKQLNATDIFEDGRIIRMERPQSSVKLCPYWQKVFECLSVTVNINITE